MGDVRIIISRAIHPSIHPTLRVVPRSAAASPAGPAAHHRRRHHHSPPSKRRKRSPQTALVHPHRYCQRSASAPPARPPSRSCRRCCCRCSTMRTRGAARCPLGNAPPPPPTLAHPAAPGRGPRRGGRGPSPAVIVYVAVYTPRGQSVSHGQWKRPIRVYTHTPTNPLPPPHHTLKTRACTPTHQTVITH